MNNIAINSKTILLCYGCSSPGKSCKCRFNDKKKYPPIPLPKSIIRLCKGCNCPGSKCKCKTIYQAEEKFFNSELSEFCKKVNDDLHDESIRHYRETAWTNTEKGRASIKRGRAVRDIRFRKASKKLSEKHLEAIKDFYFNCPEGYEVDHIIPLSKGGKHRLSNMQYLTIRENRRKAARLYYEMTSLS